VEPEEEEEEEEKEKESQIRNKIDAETGVKVSAPTGG